MPYYHQLLQLIQDHIPMAVVHKALEATGALALAAKIVPSLLAWGIPAAKRAADTAARLALNSPLRPLILWQAPAIIRILRSVLDALQQIAQAFEDELEKDLAAAASPEPSVPASTPQAPAAGDKPAGS